jgi:hypothetical protein
MSCLDLKASNMYLIDLIKTGEPFFISRLGGEIINSYNYMVNKKLTYTGTLDVNAGIYIKNDMDLVTYYQMYYNAVKNSDALAVFNSISNIASHEKYFMNNIKLQGLSSRVLEPFYLILENQIPWSHHLLGKKILIISPFVDSFQKQLTNGFNMFVDPTKRIFHKDQEFVFYKSFNTLAGNHIHSNWIETFNIMCEDISKLDFDIALLSCGGYGMPLSNYIKNNLKKSVIYVGGGLQLLFGVIGQRWLTHPIIGKIIQQNSKQFIRPSGNEIVRNKHMVENGCYW